MTATNVSCARSSARPASIRRRRKKAQIGCRYRPNSSSNASRAPAQYRSIRSSSVITTSYLGNVARVEKVPGPLATGPVGARIQAELEAEGAIEGGDVAKAGVQGDVEHLRRLGGESGGGGEQARAADVLMRSHAGNDGEGAE